MLLPEYLFDLFGIENAEGVGGLLVGERDCGVLEVVNDSLCVVHATLQRLVFALKSKVIVIDFSSNINIFLQLFPPYTFQFVKTPSLHLPMKDLLS